jgi:arylsulfatase A-like enzyme
MIPSRPLRAAVVAALALLTAACGGERAPEERSLGALVAAERFAVAPAEADEMPLLLPAAPEARVVRIDDERRPAVLLPEGAWTWRTTVPPGGHLQLGVGAPPREEAQESDAAVLEVQVNLVSEGEREVLEVARGGRREEGGAGWLDLGADLSRWAGREVTLEIEARRSGESGGGADGDSALLAWAPAVVAAGHREGSAERPNVLFVVIDTLRHDHMTSYGYERDTAPEIDARLARRGTVMEDAYSQAPWTLPSVVSYMTGRYPGELLGDDPAAYGLPEGVTSLTEEMAALGYRTAGFVANPALHEGNGMARGFETFHSPQGIQGLELHADSINRRAIPWLRAHRDEPFFLYVHYIDPHDPYWNPDLVDGRSPWFEDPGGISGRWVHGVYTGRLPVDDLERTVEHFTALYDSEIRYVDRAVAELLAAIPPEVLADTLIVLTSDHGEELYDHGGWKHGHTLYEDQIHVPLIFRWDGRIPAGRRLPGTVRLVDVAPTLLSAAGGEVPASWQGEDLLPALTGDEPLPRMAAYAEDLQVGPLRAATVADGKKLILYNRTEPFEPQNGLQETIHTLDQSRLGLVELYDVEADPGERANLAREAEAGPMTRLEAVLYHRLDRTLPGVRVLTDALAPGTRLVGELDFESPPEGAIPLFLAEGDSVTVDGTRVRFEITGGAVDKGFRLLGEPGGLVAAALSVDGEAVPDGRLRYGDGRPFGGRPVPAGALEVATFPAAGPREGRPAGLRVWSPAGAVSMATETNQETLERLKALGYVE